jgi:uncharacterized protein YigE (DUF2233 family)
MFLMSKRKLVARRYLIFGVVILAAILVAYQERSGAKDVEKKTEVKKIDLPGLANELLTPNPQPTTTLEEEWQELTDGVARRGISYPYNGSTYQIQVLRIDPKRRSISLQYDQAGKQVSAWSKENPGSIVTNAGFFKENNEPVGLLYIDGERKDSHRINPAMSGLLLIEEHSVKFLNLANTPIPDDQQMQNALQTYPMLIDNARVIVSQNSTKQDRRTAIGADGEGNFYIITAQYPHLSLYDLAKILVESPLSLTEVLNLDGGGSTGIAIQTDEFTQVIDSQTPVPSVLVVGG